MALKSAQLLAKICRLPFQKRQDDFIKEDSTNSSQQFSDDHAEQDDECTDVYSILSKKNPFPPSYKEAQVWMTRLDTPKNVQRETPITKDLPGIDMVHLLQGPAIFDPKTMLCTLVAALAFYQTMCLQKRKKILYKNVNDIARRYIDVVIQRCISKNPPSLSAVLKNHIKEFLNSFGGKSFIGKLNPDGSFAAHVSAQEKIQIINMFTQYVRADLEQSPYRVFYLASMGREMMERARDFLLEKVGFKLGKPIAASSPLAWSKTHASIKKGIPVFATVSRIDASKNAKTVKEKSKYSPNYSPQKKEDHWVAFAKSNIAKNKVAYLEITDFGRTQYLNEDEKSKKTPRKVFAYDATHNHFQIGYLTTDKTFIAHTPASWLKRQEPLGRVDSGRNNWHPYLLMKIYPLEPL